MHKVKIVEYMSMTCPHCAHFHNDDLRRDQEEVCRRRQGSLRHPRIPLRSSRRRSLHAGPLQCAKPEELSTPEQYFPMVSMLFKQQETWAAAEDGRAALLQMSKLAGFTEDSFTKCLTNQKLLDEVNATRERGSKEFGVNATPTFLINGKRYSGDMSVDTLSALIDSLL
jgi:protein-disulfide isomerase